MEPNNFEGWEMQKFKKRFLRTTLIQYHHFTPVGAPRGFDLIKDPRCIVLK